MIFLCSVEAVNLNNLFMDCNDLSTVRGGGLSVLEVGKQVVERLRAQEISTGASQGLFLMEGEDKLQVETRIRQTLAQLDELLAHATIAVCAEPFEEARFGEIRQLLKARQRWEQMRAPSVVYPKLYGQSVCKIDNLRPGRQRADPMVQSDFTHLRRQRGRERKTALIGELLGGGQCDVVNKLDELGAGGDDLGNLKDKIAVLRFDGNDFGRISARCAKPRRLSDFSSTVRGQQEGYFRRLIQDDPGGLHGWWTNDIPHKLRMEIVVYGGDEVALITPAWLGWRALRCFFEEAEKQPPFEETPITYSAGLVFCHSKSPIHAVKELASQLADEAKKEKPKGNYVVYQVLESFDAIGRGLEEHFAERFAFCGGQGVRLDLHAIRTLEDHMSPWRAGIAKGKLISLVRNIIDGSPVANLNEVIAGLFESKAGHANHAREALERLAADSGSLAFLHVLELWDYVSPEFEEA